MIILHFQVLVMFVQIFIFVELAGSCRSTKEILAQIIVSVVYVGFAVRLVTCDPSCHCAQLRLFVILVKMVPFVLCTLPSFISLPFFNFSQNCYFLLFSSFWLGIWTMLCIMPLHSAIFCNFRQNRSALSSFWSFLLAFTARLMPHELCLCVMNDATLNNFL